MGETGILSSRTTSRDQLPLFPDTRMLEQVEAPDEVDNRVTGLSRARSGKAASYSRRPVAPLLRGSHFPVRRPQNTRVKGMRRSAPSRELPKGSVPSPNLIDFKINLPPAE